MASFSCLLVPPVAAKTRRLRIVAGFIDADVGQRAPRDRTSLRCHPVIATPASLFQSYALFPHMSVADNVAFGLRCSRCRRPKWRRSITEPLRLVRLDHISAIGCRGKYPRWPAASAWALARRAGVSSPLGTCLLLDEPLSNRCQTGTAKLGQTSALKAANCTSSSV